MTISKLPAFVPDSFLDTEVDALTTIQEMHSMNHRGKMFHTSHKFTAVADAASVEVLIKVGSGEMHLNRFRINAGAGDLDSYLFEDTTVSADGTGMVEMCTNRGVSNTPTATFFHTPTVTGDVTQIHHQWIPPTASGVGQSANGIANADAGEEWELPASTNHLHRITNNSGGDIDIWVEYLWYEP